MKIYISGKISGLSEDDYYCNFGMAGEELYKLYPEADIVSPLGLKPFLGIKKWLFFMISDLRVLKTCTHIAYQPNWMQSMGAFIEMFYAIFILKIETIELKLEFKKELQNDTTRTI